MSRRSLSSALAAVLVLALLTVVSVAPARQAPNPLGAGKAASGQEVVPGEVIVRFKEGTSGSERVAARSRAGAGFERQLLLPRTQLVQVNEGEEKEAAARLEQDPNVDYAEPNAILHAQVTPNDTRFGDLWGLHNTAQTVRGVTGLADADIDGPEAWNIGRGLGSSVRVAVVDTGVAATHPDLGPNMFINPGESGGGKETNGLDDDANGKIDDFRGWDFVNNDNNPADDNDHGTHVAGTIAARSNNSFGVAGTAGFPTAAGAWFGPKIVAIKVLNAAGSGSFAGIADGFVYAGTIGAKVANASLGGGGTSTTLDNAIKSRPGTLFVVAAGNGGGDGVGDDNDVVPVTPCNPDATPDAANKICVAATDNRDLLGSFSNFGDVNVDLSGPGVSVLSSLPRRTFLSETFETPIAGRWTNADAGQTPAGSPRWERSTLFSSSPSFSITDSPGGTAAAPTPYANNQNNWVRNVTGLNLTGGTGCSLTGTGKIDTESGFDFFRIEVTQTPGTPASWQSIFTFSGVGQGTIDSALPAAINGQPNVFVRLRLTSDGSITDDGAYIDDLKIRCFHSTLDATSFDFFNGTSMATPHVAGAAGFLFTRFPTATVAAIKDKILRGVDTKASLTGKVLTGGRLNLYKAAAESTAAVSGGQLRFTAGAGQTNNVTVTRVLDGGVFKYQITDPYSTSTTAPQSGSRINPGAGCTRTSNVTVRCPVAGITRIVLNGGDLNDTLNAGTIAIPVTLDGGTGLDILTGGTAGDSLIGGANPDRFTGGTGNDVISARNEDVDTLFSCGENAGDSDTVNGDLAPNDPITASPTNCEVVSKL